VPSDLFFSYPLSIKDGEWKIEERDLDEQDLVLLMESAKELTEEKKTAMALFK
jgi:malate/lactate dehydrogenase